MCFAILPAHLSAEKEPERGLPDGDFYCQISDVVSWNKNAILKVRENFRMASSMNIIDGAEVDMNLKI